MIFLGADNKIFVSDFPTYFTSTFPTPTGREPVTYWNELIQDEGCLWNGITYVEKTLLLLIDECIHTRSEDGSFLLNYTNFSYMHITGLTPYQRHNFYKSFPNICLDFSKSRRMGTDCDIVIKLNRQFFTITSYRKLMEIRNSLGRYGHIPIEIVREFYENEERNQRLVNSLVTTADNILCSNPITYALYKKMLNYNPPIPRISNNNLNNVHIFQQGPFGRLSVNYNTPAPTIRNTEHKFVNQNKKIQLELADIIFDVKDSMTDNQYKTLMETLAKIK